MKKLIFLFMVFFYLNANSQVKILELKPFIDIVKFEAQMTSVTAFVVSKGKSKTVNIKDFLPIVDAYILNFDKKGGNEDAKNAELLSRYKSYLKKYIDGIYSFAGSNSDIHYNLKPVIEEITNLPMGFAQFNNSLTFYQSGVYYDKILNTIRLSADERASLIAKECVVPSLNNFKPLLDIDEIKYFGLIYSFVAKDFTSDEVINAEGETVTIILPKEILKKLMNLEITPEEVYSSATFYNSNKNSGGILRKINIK